MYQVSINCPTSAFIPRLPDNNPNSLLTLSDHADLSVLNTVSPSTDSYQSSRAYLAATWTVTTLQGLEPVRYEVSAGRSSETSPLGVFDLLEDRVWRDVGLETSSVIAVPAGQSQVLCHCRFHRSGTVPCYFHRSVAVLSLSFLPFVPTDHSKFCISVAPIGQSQFLVVPTGQSQFCVSVVITVPCHCRSHRSVCSPSCHSHMSVTVVSLSFPQVSHSSLSLSFPRVSNTYADKSVVFVMMMHVAKFCAR